MSDDSRGSGQSDGRGLLALVAAIAALQLATSYRALLAERAVALPDALVWAAVGGALLLGAATDLGRSAAYRLAVCVVGAVLGGVAYAASASNATLLLTSSLTVAGSYYALAFVDDASVPSIGGP